MLNEPANVGILLWESGQQQRHFIIESSPKGIAELLDTGIDSMNDSLYRSLVKFIEAFPHFTESDDWAEVQRLTDWSLCLFVYPSETRCVISKRVGYSEVQREVFYGPVGQVLKEIERGELSV